MIKKVALALTLCAVAVLLFLIYRDLSSYRGKELQKEVKKVHDQALAKPLEKYDDPSENLLLAQKENFHIVYEAEEDKFSIVITNKDYEGTRKIAEEYFMREVLKTNDKNVACRVKVFIHTLGDLNPTSPPANSLSFCPEKTSSFGNPSIVNAAHSCSNVWSSDADCQCSDMTPYFGSRSWAARKVAARESACNPSAIGGAGERGLFQISTSHCGGSFYCDGASIALSSNLTTCRSQLSNATNNKVVACDLSGGSSTSTGGSNFTSWGACDSTNANDCGHDNICSPIQDDGTKASSCQATLNVNSTGVSGAVMTTGSGGQCGSSGPTACGGTTNYTENRSGNSNGNDSVIYVDVLKSGGEDEPKPGTIYYFNDWDFCTTFKDWNSNGRNEVCFIKVFGGLTNTIRANFVRSGEVIVTAKNQFGSSITISGFSSSGGCYTTNSGACGTAQWKMHRPRLGFTTTITAPATDPSGYVWDGWSGCDSGNGTGSGASKSCGVTVANTDSQSPVANYETFVPTDTPTPTPSPTPVVDKWIKLKSGSYGTAGVFSQIIPSTVLPFDASDPGRRYFIDTNLAGETIYDEGTAVGNPLSLGGAPVSAKGWIATTSKKINLTPQSYLDYVKARRGYKNADGTTIETKKVNLINGSLTIGGPTTTETNITGADLIAKAPLVIIATGDITISGSSFNTGSASIALVSLGTLSFDPAISQANGIFIANQIDPGETTDLGLKIVGSIRSQTSMANTRSWLNNTKPSIYIVEQAKHFIELLPLLSVSLYKHAQQ